MYWEVLHSDWLVWRHRSLWRRSLHLETSCFLSVNESTGAVWLHFLSDQHCHRNVTRPCCCGRVLTSQFAQCSVCNRTNNKQTNKQTKKPTVCNSVWVQSSCEFEFSGSVDVSVTLLVSWFDLTSKEIWNTFTVNLMSVAFSVSCGNWSWVQVPMCHSVRWNSPTVPPWRLFRRLLGNVGSY